MGTPESMKQPLLSPHRLSSSGASFEEAEEVPVTKRWKLQTKPERRGFWIQFGLGLWAGLATLGEQLSAFRVTGGVVIVVAGVC